MLGGVHFRGWERGVDFAVPLFLVYPVLCCSLPMFVLALHIYYGRIHCCHTKVHLQAFRFTFGIIWYLIARTIFIQIRFIVSFQSMAMLKLPGCCQFLSRSGPDQIDIAGLTLRT